MCNSGEQVISGGGTFDGGFGIDDEVIASYPAGPFAPDPTVVWLTTANGDTPLGWFAMGLNQRPFTRTWYAVAVCVATS